MPRAWSRCSIPGGSGSSGWLAGLALVACTAGAGVADPSPEALESVKVEIPALAAVDVAGFFAAFEGASGEGGSGEGAAGAARMERMHDWAWPSYEWPPAALDDVCDYLRHGPDGPGKRLAAFVSIGFRDPRAARALLAAGRSEHLSNETRMLCLNAAPCVFGIGDWWWSGDPAETDRFAEFAAAIEALADSVETNGLGATLASRIRELDARRRVAVAGTGDAAESQAKLLGTALWRASAHLTGNLDLSDDSGLAPLLDPDEAPPWSIELTFAVSLAANRDFFAETEYGAGLDRTDPEFAKVAIRAAKTWWRRSARTGPTDWRGDVVEGFGFARSEALELDRASWLVRLRSFLVADSPVHRFNAYRLLDSIAGTHFDLEFVFLLDKYATHPLTRQLSAARRERQLRAWWRAWIDARLAEAAEREVAAHGPPLPDGAHALRSSPEQTKT